MISLAHKSITIDVNDRNAPNVIGIVNVNDKATRYLDVTLTASGEKLTFADCTVTATFATDGYLISDAVACTLNSTADVITVPLENFKSTSGFLAIEIKIANGETQILNTPLTLKVKVTPSLAENSKINNESIGSFADISREVAAARGDSADLNTRFTADEASLEAVKSEITTARGSSNSLGARFDTVDTNLAKKADRTNTLAGYGIINAYTKTEMLNLLANKADKSTTLAGYGISDTYTREEVQKRLAKKLDSMPFDSEPKQDSPCYLTSGTVYNALQTKADDNSVYTKTEADNLLGNKADKTDLGDKIGRKKVISYNKNSGEWIENAYISVNSKMQIVPISNESYAYYRLEIPNGVSSVFFWFKKILKATEIRWYAFVDNNENALSAHIDAYANVSSYTNKYAKLDVPHNATALYITIDKRYYKDLIITFDSYQDFSKSTKYSEELTVDDVVANLVQNNELAIEKIKIIEKYKTRENINASYFREHLRPKYHITAEIGSLADPCGFVYFNGQYHLYFQYNPYTVFRNTATWGHLVSDDMIQWNYAPVAIPRTDDYDIWSGNCVVDYNNVSGLGENVLLAYCTEYDGTSQSNAIYYSYDGYKFERYKTFLSASQSPTASSSKDFRDPKVIWYPPGQYYIMSICCYKSVAFYKSTDLINWTYVNKYDYEEQMECPNIVYYEEFDCMAIFMAISKTTYVFYGKWSKDGFSILTAGKSINGGYPYAMDTLTNSPDGKIYGIAFCSPSKSTTLYNLMTSVVELDMTNISTKKNASRMKCVQKPLDLLLNTFTTLDSFEYNVTTNKSYNLPINLSSGYVHLEFDYSGVEEDARGKYPSIRLFTSATEYLLIQYNKPGNYIAVNRTYCGDKSNYDGLVPTSDTFTLADDKLTLDILFDERIVEVFVNGGEVAITVPVLPRAAGIIVDGKASMKIAGSIYSSPYLLDNHSKIMSNMIFNVPKNNNMAKLTADGIRVQSFNTNDNYCVLSKEKVSPSFIKTDFVMDSFFNDKTVIAKVIFNYIDDNNYICVDYGTTSIAVRKVESGVSSVLTSVDTSISRGVAHEARIEYKDNVLSVYFDGDEIATCADITESTGYIGLGSAKYGSVVFNNIYIS